MYAACPAYKTNKKKLMGDMRILKTFLDGKISCVTANNMEQLNILISNSKKNLGVSLDRDTEIGKAKQENEPIEQQKWFWHWYALWMLMADIFQHLHSRYACPVNFFES